MPVDLQLVIDEEVLTWEVWIVAGASKVGRIEEKASATLRSTETGRKRKKYRV